jgi:acyl carrier protein
LNNKLARIQKAMQSLTSQNTLIEDKPNTSSNMSTVDIVPVIGAVICQELGIDTDEVEVDTDLRQSGLNSLSALMITVRLLEEYGIDLGPGTLKENYSLCKLRKALHRKSLEAEVPKQDPSRVKTPALILDTTLAEAPSSSETDISALTLSSSKVAVAPLVKIESPEGIPPRVMAIIAEEMNIDHAEFADPVEWANLGLDSIMSLTICGRLREELEMDVESTVFADHESVGAFKKHLSEIQSSS